MHGQTNKHILGNKLQRQLRKAPTDAEHTLWQRLRGRQLEGCKFRRQHPYDDYILDFVCLDRKVIVEVDGGQHDEQREYDETRTASLESAGFVVLRFWNNEVLGDMDGVLEAIRQRLDARAKPSPPNPPLEGEG
ncbi:MAG TPA: endonuclease domain-containing protein [Casimicrobiaceae bacterium]